MASAAMATSSPARRGVLVAAVTVWACGVDNPAYRPKAAATASDAAAVDAAAGTATAGGADARSSARDASARDLASPPPSPAGNLVGWWSFDEADGTVAIDGSGAGNHGQFAGALASSAVRVAGKRGQALALDGAAYVVVPASPSLDAITREVSLCAWVYATSWRMLEDIITRQRNRGSTEHYGLAVLGDGRPDFFLAAAGEPTGTGAVPLNRWVHLAATFDGRNANLYVDGARVAASVVDNLLAADVSPLIIGGNQNDASGVVDETWRGLLDDVRLYDRALTAAEVATLAAP